MNATAEKRVEEAEVTEALSAAVTAIGQGSVLLIASGRDGETVYSGTPPSNGAMPWELIRARVVRRIVNGKTRETVFKETLYSYTPSRGERAANFITKALIAVAVLNLLADILRAAFIQP